jgi:hypothetical protein
VNADKKVPESAFTKQEGEKVISIIVDLTDKGIRVEQR